MASESDIERPKTSRGRRHYEGVPSASTDYAHNLSQYSDDKLEQYDPVHIPRPRSSRQRPKSGYKVRRHQPQMVQPDMYSDDYHLYERSTNSVHYTDGITAAAAKLHQDSPRSSYDSGVYDNQVDQFAPMPSPRPSSSRPGSTRPSTRQRQQNRNLTETSEPSDRPSSSRPGSASSFSRYAVLPQIGSVSNSNTPEPPFSGKIMGTSLSDYREESQIQPHTLPKEFIREHSFVGRKYKDIHESFDRKMKELSMANEVNQESTYSDNTGLGNDFDKSAIIHIPTVDDTVGHANNKTSMDPTAEHQSTVLDPLVLSYPPLQRKVVLPVEPKEGEARLLLAVKLPNGQRVQRHFKTTDQLLHVLRFAEYSAQLDFSNCEVVCDAPRKVFKELNIKLMNSGLQNRTVLHIQIPDE